MTTEKRRVSLYTHQCLRCEHTWDSLLGEPTRCPHCGSPYWDRPKKGKAQKGNGA